MENKELFVKEFGELCNKHNIQGVESMQYVENSPYPYIGSERTIKEAVQVKFKGGGIKIANVGYDSCYAIIIDILKQVF